MQALAYTAFPMATKHAAPKPDPEDAAPEGPKTVLTERAGSTDAIAFMEGKSQPRDSIASIPDAEVEADESDPTLIFRSVVAVQNLAWGSAGAVHSLALLGTRYLPLGRVAPSLRTPLQPPPPFV